MMRKKNIDFCHKRLELYERPTTPVFRARFYIVTLYRSLNPSFFIGAVRDECTNLVARSRMRCLGDLPNDLCLLPFCLRTNLPLLVI